MAETKYLGNKQLLSLHKIGFIASRHASTLDVIPTLDWAVEISKSTDVAVVSGFQSPLEKDVLKFLLRGVCPIIIVLARGMYRKLPDALQTPMDQQRLLIISNESDNTNRVSEITAHKRNEYVISISDEMKIIK
ncbi:MAG: hypothetical protein MR724_07885 [Prevotella sp.]|nr:hypothetical protein [Prevotella sp.]